MLCQKNKKGPEAVNAGIVPGEDGCLVLHPEVLAKMAAGLVCV